MKKKIISLLIITTALFCLSSPIAAAEDDFAPMNVNSILNVPGPDISGAVNVEYLGISIKRFQPAAANSENTLDYISLVEVAGLTEWFISKDNMQANNYKLDFNNDDVRKFVFSEKQYLDDLAVNNNMLESNRNFKISVQHIFRLPNGLDYYSDEKVIFVSIGLPSPIIEVVETTTNSIKIKDSQNYGLVEVEREFIANEIISEWVESSEYIFEDLTANTKYAITINVRRKE